MTPKCDCESDDDDVDMKWAVSDNQTSTNPAQHALPFADTDTSADPFLQTAWWPSLTPLLEEPPSLATARVNAGDLIDRALFHAETTAACQHSVPSLTSRDGRLLWGAVAEITEAGPPHSNAGWHGPLAALPGPWENDPNEFRFKIAHWRSTSADDEAVGGVAPHMAAPHPAWAAAGGADWHRGPTETAAAKEAAERGQMRWERLAMLADEAEDGARLGWRWGLPGCGSADSACRV